MISSCRQPRHPRVHRHDGRHVSRADGHREHHVPRQRKCVRAADGNAGPRSRGRLSGHEEIFRNISGQPSFRHTRTLFSLTYIRQKKDLLFLRQFFEKTNARGEFF